MAARRGMLGMVASNTPVAAFPPGGLRPVVGTNPFAFAAPVGEGPPLVVDISMTAVSGSKVIAARLAGDSIPEGWVLDAEGNPTTDPQVAFAAGGLELLGGAVARHKGYGLGLMIDTLGILAGNGSGIWQRGTPTWTQGQWFAAWRVDLFTEPDAFLLEMRRVADYVHETPARRGATVALPGERRAASRLERTRHGVPIEDGLAGRLRELGEQTGVRFPAPRSGAGSTGHAAG